MERIRSYNVPVVVFFGAHDTLVNPFNSKHILAPALNAKLVDFPDGGHGINEQYATEVNEELRKMIEEGLRRKNQPAFVAPESREPYLPGFWHPWKVIVFGFIVAIGSYHRMGSLSRFLGIRMSLKRYLIATTVILCAILRRRFGSFIGFYFII